MPAHGQTGSAVTGRVFDAASGAPVPDATVEIAGTRFSSVSSGRGLFRFERVPAGRYEVVITHVAYGTHRQPLDVGEGVEIAVRVDIAQEAIRLDPMVVSVMTETQLRDRSRGTRVNEITREEIQSLIPTSRTLADMLQQAIPGIRSRSTAMNESNCIEFRTPATLRWMGRCRSPMVFLDGVRMWNPPNLYSTIELGTINRIEVLPPAEAGVAYGTDSSFGVILIETRTFQDTRDPLLLPRELMTDQDYNWDLDPDPHPTLKVFLGSMVGNAIGLGLGLAAARQCIDFERVAVDIFNTSCGSLGTAGARLGAVVLPSLGAATAARYIGDTEMSRGRFVPTALAAGLAVLPGYALASTSTKSGMTTSGWSGAVWLLLAVPAAATAADYVYRAVLDGWRERR